MFGEGWYARLFFVQNLLCLFFSEIFPYLVMIIGLENVLVITKSVVSTPVHLDVKIRVAQGKKSAYLFIDVIHYLVNQQGFVVNIFVGR